MRRIRFLLQLSLDKSFIKTESIGMKVYVETGYADIKRSNFYEGANVVASKKKAEIIFSI